MSDHGCDIVSSEQFEAQESDSPSLSFVLHCLLDRNDTWFHVKLIH
jgi:hypothetical protein